MDDVLVLISQEQQQDGCGVQHSVEVRRQIFCKACSVKRSEFYAAGQSGLAPEFMFTIFLPDYGKETELEFHGERYAVYRTFRKSADELEVYVQRKGGVQ